MSDTVIEEVGEINPSLIALEKSVIELKELSLKKNALMDKLVVAQYMKNLWGDAFDDNQTCRAEIKRQDGKTHIDTLLLVLVRGDGVKKHFLLKDCPAQIVTRDMIVRFISCERINIFSSERLAARFGIKLTPHEKRGYH